jgi:type IV fimbrial biogenesis protein FimT
MLKLLYKSKMSGFSMIELMVVITIMAVVMALGIPSYNEWIQNTKIRSAAESIQNGVLLARAEAVKRNARVQFTLDALGSAWVVGCETPVADDNGDGLDDCPAEIQVNSGNEGSSAEVTVVSTDDTPFVFSSLGTLVSPAPSAADNLVRITVDNSALSTAESRELTIVLGVGGNARTCDPSLDSAGTDPRKCP